MKSLTFGDLGVSGNILKALEEAGFTQPTEVQAKTIPFQIEGKDLIAQAKTGSGKTLAFALPAIQKIGDRKGADVLVLAPTRELAQQVSDEFKKFSKKMGIQSTCVVGKESYSRQIDGINRGSQVVIATPGRLLDLLQGNKLRKFAPRTVILDEADEMLNMGFIEDIRNIFALLPEERQTIFFSATFPEPIIKLAKSELKSPEILRLDKEKKQASTTIEQNFFILKESERKDALIRLLDWEQPGRAIVFCRTKGDTEALNSLLVSRKFKAKALHGDLSQAERNRTTRDFKQGLFNILIATDIASRGLDVDDLSHVFNFNIPENYDRYTHRIGRTGRAGRTGKALTLTTMTEWSTNYFLRQLDFNIVNITQLPNKKKVEDIKKEKLLGLVQSTEFTSDTRKICEEIIAKEDSFDLLCKLFTLISNENRVQGPQNIGLLQDNIKDFLARVKSPRGRSRRSNDWKPRGFSRGRGNNYSSRRKRSY